MFAIRLRTRWRCWPTRFCKNSRRYVAGSSNISSTSLFTSVPSRADSLPTAFAAPRRSSGWLRWGELQWRDYSITLFNRLHAIQVIKYLWLSVLTLIQFNQNQICVFHYLPLSLMVFAKLKLALVGYRLRSVYLYKITNRVW